MQIKDAKRTLIILSLALAGCQGTIAPATSTPEVVSLRLIADSSTMPLLRDLTSNYHPSGMLITWDIQSSDTAAISDWLKTSPYALTDYVPTAFDKALWSTPVGQDGIAIVVHPSNAVANLTAAQLRAILSGRTDNWSSVGGANLPITVVARDDGSSAASIIQSIVLGDRRTTRTALLALTDSAVIDLVSANPGAIGYVSMSYLSSAVRAVPLEGIALTADTVRANQYPIRAPIIFIGPKEPANDAYRAFFAWIQSEPGQAIVRRHSADLGNP